MSVIPLGDASRRPTRWPAVTAAIIVANFVVFAFELAGGDAFVLRWSVVPAQIASGQHLITVLTAMFMHGGWSHIIGNMIFLWAFGPEVEEAMGRPRYLIFYLVGGIAAMLAQVAAGPHSTVPNLGASGAIAAVMGAFMVAYPADRIRTLLFFFVFVRVRYIPAMVLIGLWFLTQLISAGQVSSVPQSGGVAYLAHIGGFAFGAVWTRLLEATRRISPEKAPAY
jgi:membrane associated rhomboid family serine protease